MLSLGILNFYTTVTMAGGFDVLLFLFLQNDHDSQAAGILFIASIEELKVLNWLWNVDLTLVSGLTLLLGVIAVD